MIKNYITLCLLVLGILPLIGQVKNINFENVSWTPSQITSSTSLDVAQKEVIDGYFFRLIQFESIPGQEQHAQLKDRDIHLISYYHNGTYLAALPIVVTAKELINYGVIAIDVVPWQAKVSKDILDGEIGDWALNGQMVSTVVEFPGSVSEAALKASLSSHKAVISEFHQEYGIAFAQVPINELYSLAKSPAVQHLSVVSQPGEPEDLEGRSLHRANIINSDALNGLKYDGSGVSVLTRDDGVVGPHIDFKGRLDNLKTAGLVTTDHADMVSGIFAGGGNFNPKAQGMASGAFLYTVNYVDHFMDNTLDLHQNNGVMVTNSSYSNGCNDGYTSTTRTVDLQINSNPTLLHVFSAGNSGTSNCGYGAGNRWGNVTGGHKIGKNVIATANLRIDVSLENSSSRGPANDGRIKPDLAARGTDELSTDPNNLYSPGGGTSAASPGVAGVSAQLYHAYRDLNNGEDPESALIKSALMNTANDLGNEGPDFKFGYGHINANRAYELLKDKRYVRSEIDQGDENVHDIVIDAPMKEVRFMLYWQEPAASPGSSKALINDLDLVVEDGNGVEYLPWVLDHTPDPAALDAPATNGVDRLNNVEQVVLRDVEPGTYKVKISGYELPFGSRPYYILYETIDNSISITYPHGGEGFSPGTEEQIHWDAVSGQGIFQLEYSTDDGASWKSLASVNGSQKTYTWNVPNEVSPYCKVRVTRGAESAVNEDPFSIVSTPIGLVVRRVCPDYVTLEWNPIEGATNYEIYLLGETKMEVIATSDTTIADVPVDDVLAEMWFSLRALGENGLRSSRSVALKHDTGLDKCSVTTDLELTRLISPNANLVYSCDKFEEPILIEVKNNGTTKFEEITVNYELDGGVTGGETIQLDLDPGEKTFVTLTDPLIIDLPGAHDIRVWIEAEMDELPGNDQISRGIDVKPQFASASLDYSEDFQDAIFPPVDWEIISEVDDVVWESASDIIGSNGSRTRCATIFSDVSRELFYSDELYTHSIDLKDADNPVLFFDYASNVDSASNYPGLFKVVVYSFCGERHYDEILSWSGERAMNQPAPGSTPWTPSNKDDWAQVGLNLKKYIGSEIVIGFIVENGFNWRFYLDNVNVVESAIDFPESSFTVSDYTPCALFSSTTVESTSFNPDFEYIWDFGETANPNTAIGPGPHNVRFFQEGEESILLEVIHIQSNAYASSTQYVEVVPRPTPRWTETVNELQVQFNNVSSNGDTYFWEFGDGNTSTEVNPTHTYMNSGTYSVMLHATNDCTTRSVEKKVTVTGMPTSDQEQNRFALEIYPNPATDFVIIRADKANYGVDILTLDGRLKELSSVSFDKGIQLDVSDLLPGIYMLRVYDLDSGEDVIQKLIVQ